MSAKKVNSSIDVKQEEKKNEKPKIEPTPIVIVDEVPDIGENDKDVKTAVEVEVEDLSLTKVTTDKKVKKKKMVFADSKEVQCDLGPDKKEGAPPAVDSLLYSAYYHPVSQLTPHEHADICECIQTTTFKMSLFSDLKTKMNDKEYTFNNMKKIWPEKEKKDNKGTGRVIEKDEGSGRLYI
uniref:Uncharacterized protein n=1 Tax=Meloidogyne incognita TaxID=6306 RepID=A0A914MKM1_MELIC